MKKISITEFIILLYIILMPFSLFGPERFGVNIKLCDFVFPFMLLSFLTEKGANLKIHLQKNKALLGFILFICAGVLSFFNSVSLGKSLLELAGYVYLLTVAFIVALSVETKEAFYRLMKTWIFMTIVVLLLAVYGLILFFIEKPGLEVLFLQYSSLEKSFLSFPRIESTFETPNMLLTYLHVSVVFSIAYFFPFMKNKPFRRFKAFSLFGFIIIAFIGAFLTLSRRFSGLLLSMLLILRRFPKQKITRYLKYIIFILFIGFFLLSLFTTIWQIFPINFSVEENIRPQISINTKFSLHLLPQLVSIRMFITHPFIGIGLGTYKRVFPNFYDAEKVIERYDIYVATTIANLKTRQYALDPHSLYLGTLAEAGIFGFLALIFFLAGIYKHIYTNIRYLRNTVDKNIVYILTCGFTGFLFNGLTTDILSMRHFWILLALIVAFISICKKEVAPANNKLQGVV